MNCLKDHVGGLVKITAIIYLYKEAKYFKLKDYICVLIENHDYLDIKGNQYNRSPDGSDLRLLAESEANTLEASNMHNQPLMMQKPLFLCSLLIDNKVIKLLFSERDFEIIK